MKYIGLILCFLFIGCNYQLNQKEMDLQKVHENLVKYVDSKLDDFSCYGRRFAPGNDQVQQETLAIICTRMSPQQKLLGWETTEKEEVTE